MLTHYVPTVSDLIKALSLLWNGLSYALLIEVVFSVISVLTQRFPHRLRFASALTADDSRSGPYKSFMGDVTLFLSYEIVGHVCLIADLSPDFIEYSRSADTQRRSKPHTLRKYSPTADEPVFNFPSNISSYF
jgi:hypothetical protein